MFSFVKQGLSFFVMEEKKDLTIEEWGVQRLRLHMYLYNRSMYSIIEETRLHNFMRKQNNNLNCVIIVQGICLRNFIFSFSLLRGKKWKTNRVVKPQPHRCENTLMNWKETSNKLWYRGNESVKDGIVSNYWCKGIKNNRT